MLGFGKPSSREHLATEYGHRLSTIGYRLHLSQMPGLPPLELTCFGPPTARLDGADPPAEVLWKKHLGLLIYLACSPHRSRSREHLVGLFWGDRPEEKARHSLNEAVRRLRASVGADRLRSSGETVSLNDDALTVDALEFERCVEEDPARAVDIAESEFMEGFHIDGAPDFSDWISRERTRLRDQVVHALLARADAALVEGNTQLAGDALRRAVATNPMSEPAVRMALRTAALSGDSSGGLALYHEFKERLKREYGEGPSPELESLAGRVRNGEWRRRSGRYWKLEPPLVGRDAVHAKAFSVVEAGLNVGPQCLLVTGDPGMGKTRLLNACAERLLLGGAVVASASPLESDVDANWSTFRSLLRGGLIGAPGVAGTAPTAMAVFAAIVPELAERVTPVPIEDTAQVGNALASLLVALADDRPVTLMIDDVQWADRQSIATVHAALRQIDDEPVTLVVAVGASGTDLSPEIGTLLGELGRELSGQSVALKPFTLDELRLLVDEMATWSGSAEERSRLARRVELESGGSPFLAVTLLRDLDATATVKEDMLTWPPPGSTYDAPLPFTMPSMVRMAIVARVSRLDPDSAALLRAASVLGVAVDPALVAALANLDDGRVDAALDRLERDRFLTYTGDRYAFNGKMVPEAVRAECVTRGEQRRVRQRAAELLEHREDLEARTARVGLMAANTGTYPVVDAIAVAEDALAAGAERTARRALDALEKAGPEQLDQASRSRLQAIWDKLRK